MGLPKSPRPLGPDGGLDEGHTSAAKFAAVGVLSPAQESEEVDAAVRNSTSENTSENGSDYDPANESEDWSDLEEEEFVGNAGGVDSTSIQSTMNSLINWKQAGACSSAHLAFTADATASIIR